MLTVKAQTSLHVGADSSEPSVIATHLVEEGKGSDSDHIAIPLSRPAWTFKLWHRPTVRQTCDNSSDKSFIPPPKEHLIFYQNICCRYSSETSH